MKYVLAFRGQMERRLTGEEEARWPAWFQQINDSIADFGSRVGQVREVEARPERSDVLSGYIVVNADSLDAAASLAGGCPALQQGGSVEVGELVEA
jgi:YCII-related domain